MRYEINADNSFKIISDKGKVIHHSRKFRLRVQAEEQAKAWIAGAIHTPIPDGAITLKVDDISVDPDALFGGKQNG